MLPLLIALVVAALYAAFSSRTDPLSESANEAWSTAIAQENSAVGRILLRVSRPIATTALVQDTAASPAYRFVSAKILASGGTFGGSTEIFMAVQAFCALLGATIVACVIAARPDRVTTLAAVLLSGALVGYPWNLVAKKANARAEEVANGLPTFAELLQMPLSAGMGVTQALAFTAERLSGPVADEVRRLIQVLASKSMPDADAFALAAARVGTPEAQSFFAACAQAHLQGATLIDALTTQAEALRFSAYQAARARSKRLPVNLVLIMGLHFIPTLLVIILIPGAMSLGSV